MLAALGVSSDILAQAQSHGLVGVQARHYDRHNYMAELRSTLEAWNQHLQTRLRREADVISIRQYR